MNNSTTQKNKTLIGIVTAGIVVTMAFAGHQYLQEQAAAKSTTTPLEHKATGTNYQTPVLPPTRIGIEQNAVPSLTITNAVYGPLKADMPVPQALTHTYANLPNTYRF